MIPENEPEKANPKAANVTKKVAASLFPAAQARTLVPGDIRRGDAVALAGATDGRIFYAHSFVDNTGYVNLSIERDGDAAHVYPASSLRFATETEIETFENAK